MRLRTLTEAECYARCYGARGDDNVTVVRVVPRERDAGEDMRRMFEERLDARDSEAEAA
jgi:hypothetical protein